MSEKKTVNEKDVRRQTRTSQKKRGVHIGYCKTVEQVNERLAIFGLVRSGD